MTTPPSPPPPAAPEPVVVTRSYDLARWLLLRTEKFPRAHRFGLGQQIQHEVLQMLSALVTASFTRDRLAALRAASLAHTRLRVLIRMAREVRCLTPRQYAFAIAPMEEVGRMIGGWSRHSAAPQAAT